MYNINNKHFIIDNPVVINIKILIKFIWTLGAFKI